MLALIILCILLTWLLCAGVCIGIGFFLLRGLRFACSITEALWTGLALITGFLQLYHFFRPIDIVAVLLLAALALAGWLWNYAVRAPGASAGNASAQQDWRERKQLGLVALLLYIPAAAIIAFRCVAVGEHYDTGLYGAQAVRWFTTYPLVPGLANLIGQLGFNSSVFLCIAALDQGPWRDLAHHLFAGFLIAAFFVSIIPAVLRISEPNPPRPSTGSSRCSLSRDNLRHQRQNRRHQHRSSHHRRLPGRNCFALPRSR